MKINHVLYLGFGLGIRDDLLGEPIVMVISFVGGGDGVGIFEFLFNFTIFDLEGFGVLEIDFVGLGNLEFCLGLTFGFFCLFSVFRALTGILDLDLVTGGHGGAGLALFAN